MKYILMLAIIALAVFGASLWLFNPLSARSQLHDNVPRADDSYALTVYGRHAVGNSEIVELRLTSQIWRGIAFKHRLFLIKPPEVTTRGQGLLVLSGGRWHETYEEPPSAPTLPDEVAIFLAIAERLETVVAVLDQVPFQPLYEKAEDRLIAYTFEQYQNSRDPEWPLLLPMVKTAVRGMDAVQAAVRTEFDIDVDRFTLLGGSKRGWTVWLTAVVDPRVTAIVPVVFDALNMEAHFPHQTAMWGAPSEKILPYTELNLHTILSSEEGRALREMVDPFAYRNSLTQPKLIVNATNDEYFPLDSANLYWASLAGESYALYLPNEGHNMTDYERLIPGLRALHRSAAGLGGMPALQWEYELGDQILKLCVRADPAPVGLRIWTATSENRDFRDEQWVSSPLQPSGIDYVFDQARPGFGYMAMYAEAEFLQGTSRFTLSTTPAVLGKDSGTRRGWSAVSQGDICE